MKTKPTTTTTTQTATVRHWRRDASGGPEAVIRLDDGRRLRVVVGAFCAHLNHPRCGTRVARVIESDYRTAHVLCAACADAYAYAESRAWAPAR